MRFLDVARGVVILALGYGFGQAQDLVIQNVTIRSPERAVALPGRHVEIRAGRITRISRTPIPAREGVRSMDGLGKFLIPGLIDSHVHLAKVPGMQGKHRKAHPDLAEAYFRQQPRSYLYFGFTTLLDTHVFDAKALARFREAPWHPDLHDCGQPVEIANGFGMYEDEPATRLAEFPNFLVDVHQRQHLPHGIDLSRHTPSRVVQAIKDQGAIALKMHYEVGFGGSEAVTYDIPSPEILGEVVREGHRRGLPTLLHANSWEAHRAGLLAGVDILAHGMWHWEEYRHAKDLPKPIQQTLDEIARRRVGYQPTMRVIGGQKDLFNKDFLGMEELHAAIPPALLAWYGSPAGQWYPPVIKRYFPPHLQGMEPTEMTEYIQRFEKKAEATLRHLAHRQGNLLLGSDTSSGNTYANPPGLNGFLELRSWAKAGVPLPQIFQAVTLANAKALRLQDSIGSVEVGKVANLLLLDLDPLVSVEAYNRIDRVILHGRLIVRAELSAQKGGE